MSYVNSTQVYMIPDDEMSEGYSFNVVTVVNNEVVSDVKHEEIIEDCHFRIHSEVKEEFIGWAYSDTPYTNNPHTQVWYDHQLEV